MTYLRPPDFDAAGKHGWIPAHGHAVSGMTAEDSGVSTIPFIPFIPVRFSPCRF
jgi:hypothetical protein